MDHTVWNRLLPELESSFTLYSMDRRGRGASGDSAAFSVDREVQDAAALVDSIGGAADVMGRSQREIDQLRSDPTWESIGRTGLVELLLAASMRGRYLPEPPRSNCRLT